MKKILAVSAVVLAVGMSAISLAANTTPTPAVTNPSASSPLHQLGIKFREDMIQIQKDVKSGKLTQAQANGLREQLKTIRKQELSELKANGTKTLTSTQESALMSQLATVEQSL